MEKCIRLVLLQIHSPFPTSGASGIAGRSIAIVSVTPRTGGGFIAGFLVKYYSPHDRFVKEFTVCRSQYWPEVLGDVAYKMKRLTGNLKLCFSSTSIILWKSTTDEKYSEDLVLILDGDISNDSRTFQEC